MKRAAAVIGAGFGDEGKGLITDYLCMKTPRALVVRFNGGAQAGHTVQSPDGRRHVFHHFGAGSFTGATTYLSQFFIVNPLLWRQEHRDLVKLGIQPTVFVDRAALVTTPYEMLVNQEAETARGNGRHGSCGVGINETIIRDEHFPIRAADIQKPALLRDRLDHVRKVIAPKRLADVGVSHPTALTEQMLESDDFADWFASVCGEFGRAVTFVEGDFLRRATDDIVFEGAQGLLLDQDHHFFPHVTRSKTGLTNVLVLAGQADIEHIDVAYVTRAYLTRHGAGPFPTEEDHLAFDDPTNRPHPFQGALRFGWLDIALTKSAIDKDLSLTDRISVTKTLAVTCLDQVEGGVQIRLPGGRLEMLPSELPEELLNELGMTEGLVSYGPTRLAVRPLRKPAGMPCTVRAEMTTT